MYRGRRRLPGLIAARHLPVGSSEALLLACSRLSEQQQDSDSSAPLAHTCTRWSPGGPPPAASKGCRVAQTTSGHYACRPEKRGPYRPTALAACMNEVTHRHCQRRRTRRRKLATCLSSCQAVAMPPGLRLRSEGRIACVKNAGELLSGHHLASTRFCPSIYNLRKRALITRSRPRVTRRSARAYARCQHTRHTDWICIRLTTVCETAYSAAEAQSRERSPPRSPRRSG
jgi:hypothetical protein